MENLKREAFCRGGSIASYNLSEKGRVLKQTSHFYFQKEKKSEAKDNLSISIIKSVRLSSHALEADRLVMSITFASTVTATEGSSKSTEVR